ncbi:MAG TPA: phage terminase large subunit family protein, partial [Candidatus Bathyarchaeia archaeon]|nr:phage terminase large subunit family protein [Candidatus Bathyarchaeia archaeon]
MIDTFLKQDIDYAVSSVESLIDKKLRLLVSEWAAKKRYLPPELTSKPGAWDNDYTKYLVKIMDCLSQRSPIRKVAILKGAQVGASTGIIENFLGYKIDHD